ncbi:MAG: tRNA (adenosine(37)-N6)-threonylcarbamoyltransferase complex ATPase subunit type 1 TsaE [Ilumatobacteraceae bacterium]
MREVKFASHTVADTVQFAEKVARELRPHDVLVLAGDLGAGKTTFTKALCAALGVVDTVTSPTFTLVHEYRGTKLVVCHADLYRLQRTGELSDLGLDDARRAGAVLVVEWGDLVLDHFDDALVITFAHTNSAGASPDDREITVGWRGPQWEARFARMFGR